MPVAMSASEGRRSSKHYPHSDEQLSLLNPVGGAFKSFQCVLAMLLHADALFVGLISVNMRNFMCHRNFTQHFYSGVNYITGENGSGKSAVIVALSAALGANFNKIGKGDDISNLIGTAEPIAVVTVTLRNDPSNPRHCDKYKNPVVIERTLVRRGEAGKISNKNSIKIDGKEVRKVDLIELMTAMSIDVCNPAVVLHQDNAKSFGDSNDGKGLYKYFLSATGLHQSLEECERCKTQVLADKANVKQCTDVQKKLREGDYAEAKLAMEKCSDLNEHRTKIEALQTDLSVLSIHEVVGKFDEKDDEIKRCEESQLHVQAQLDQLQHEFNEIIAEGVAQQDVTEQLSEMGSIEQQIKHLARKSQDYKSELGRKTSEKNQAEQSIRRIEKQIKDEEKARDDARADFERQDRNNGKRVAAKLKEEAESLNQKVQQRHAELQTGEAEIEELDHELRRAHAQFEELKSEISNLEERIRKTKSSRGKVVTRDEIIRRFQNQNPQYRADLVQVRNAIDAAQKRRLFRGSTPLGPLGMHVTVTPEGRKFYNPIAQTLGSKTLGAFLFDSDEDREAFKSSKEYEALGRVDLVMYVLPSSVQNQIDDSRSTFQAVPGSVTHACAKLLVFDNPWAKNAVLQFANPDKSQVVEHYDKSLGHKALDSLHDKPKGFSVTIRAIDGHETTATAGGGIQSTTNLTKFPSDIFDRSETIDVEASLREMEAERQGLTQEYQQADREKRKISDRIGQLRDRAQRLQSEIVGYQKKRKQNLSDARDLEIEAENLPEDFDESVFEDGIRSKQAILNARKDEISRFDRELEVISNSNAQVQEQMKKETEKRQKIEAKMQSMLLFL
jgi:chromosome segregation ATPase